MRIKAIIGAFLLTALAVTASAQWMENGKTVPDTSWRKAWGKYGAMLHLTNKPDELFAAWEKPGATVPVDQADSVERGKPIVGVVFFSGCAVDVRGFCNAEVSYSVFKPNGELYAQEKNSELWVGKTSPSTGQLQLSIGAIGVKIEPQDPSGTYTVRAHLFDKISKAEVELMRTFRVSK